MVLTKTPASTRIRPVRAKNLASFPWLVHGFSTRQSGFSKVYGGNALNLGFTREDSRAAVERNRQKFLEELGAKTKSKPWPLVTLRQVHSDLIHCVRELPKSMPTGDGLVTDVPGLLVAVLTADCIPVIVVDPKRKAVGVFHAGWRGTVKRIVEKGVGEMRRWFGSDPRQLKAVIGPGVHRCCYQVGAEVRAQFESQFSYAGKLFDEICESDPVHEKYPLLFLTARAPGHSELPRNIFLDLPEANRQQLLAAGLSAKSITVSSLCTACNPDQFFSYRTEKGVTGRMMAVAGIRPSKRS
jgi:YfiH family protein